MLVLEKAWDRAIRLGAVKTYRCPGPFGVFAEETYFRPIVWHFAGKPMNDNAQAWAKPQG